MKDSKGRLRFAGATVDRASVDVREWVESRQRELVALLFELLAIESITGNETELARYCVDWYRRHGIEAELRPCRGRFNVVASVGSGVDAMIVSGHLDTVPPNRGGWTVDPLRPEERDGKVYGLGASDLKGALAAAMFATLHASERGLGRSELVPFPFRLINAFTVEEETTGAGTKEYVESAVASGELDPSRTVAVVIEPTGLGHLSLGNRGAMTARVELTGLGGHGSRPHLARNPLLAVARIVNRLPAFVDEWNHRFPDPDFVEFGGATVTPTSFEGGEARGHNVIPQRASMVLDLRLTESLYSDGFAVVTRELTQFLRGAAGSGIDVEVRMDHPRAGQKIASDHPIVKMALATLRDDLGIDASVRYTPAGNDAVFFAQHGIEVLNKVGPGLPECAHRVDEYIPIDLLLRGTEFYIRLAQRWGESILRARDVKV